MVPHQLLADCQQTIICLNEAKKSPDNRKYFSLIWDVIGYAYKASSNGPNQDVNRVSLVPSCKTDCQQVSQ